MSSNGKRKTSLKSKLAIGTGTGLIVVFGGAGIAGVRRKDENSPASPRP